jgi:hypothetical protein
MIPQEIIDWIAGEKAKGYTSEQLYDILMQYKNEEAEVREALKIVFQPTAPVEPVKRADDSFKFNFLLLGGIAIVLLIAVGVFGYSIYKDNQQTNSQDNIQKELVKKLEAQKQKQEKISEEEKEEETENTLSPQELVFAEFINAKKEGDMKKVLSKTYFSESSLKELEEIEKTVPPEEMPQFMEMIQAPFKEYKNLEYIVKNTSINEETAVLLISATKDGRQKVDKQVFFVKEGDEWFINTFGFTHPADTVVETATECNTYCASQNLYSSGNLFQTETKECTCWYDLPIFGEAMSDDTCEEKPKNMRDGCYLLVAEGQKEEKYCKNVSSMNRNTCYEKVAVAKQDESVCDEIWEDSRCLEEVRKSKKIDEEKEALAKKESEDLECFWMERGVEACYSLNDNKVWLEIVVNNLSEDIFQMLFSPDFSTFNDQEIWKDICDITTWNRYWDKNEIKDGFSDISEKNRQKFDQLVEQLDFENDGVEIRSRFVYTSEGKEYIINNESCAKHGHPIEIQKSFSSKYFSFDEYNTFDNIPDIINGSLDFGDLTIIPEGFQFPKRINGYLDLSGLTTLPEGIQFPEIIEGSLNFSGLTTLPEGFQFPKRIQGLILSGLTTLPEGFQFPQIMGWKIDLSGLTTLPEGIQFPETIEGDLDLSGLITLPEGIQFPEIIEGDLDLTGLTTLPEGIQFPETMEGELNLTGLTTLPEGFQFPKRIALLDLKNVTTLPVGIQFPETMVFLGLPELTTLPADVQFPKRIGWLDLKNVTTLPAGIQFPEIVEKSLDLSAVTTLFAGVQFPETINGDLDLSGVTTLPADVQFPKKIEGKLNLSEITTLPAGVHFPEIIGNYLRINRLPEEEINKLKDIYNLEKKGDGVYKFEGKK